MLRVVALGVCLGCGGGASAPLPDPSTGITHRYVVDRFTLPHNNTEARALGDDLDGDRNLDNALGMAIGALSTQADITSHGDDMAAAGAIASTVQITADNLGTDPAVAIRYLGAPGDDPPVLRAAFDDGFLESTRVRSGDPTGSATVHIPVFADADPTILALDNVELDLRPDGQGGYDGALHGTLDPIAANTAAATGLLQMMFSTPADHVDFARFVDGNHDGFIALGEVQTSSLVTGLLHPDVTIAGANVISIGFGIHLKACESGRCAGAIVDHCHDRVRDGDETDVDCGGACQACPGSARCTIPADCQSRACGTDGVCAAPSCHDGVADGFEDGIDCGWNGCPACGT